MAPTLRAEARRLKVTTTVTQLTDMVHNVGGQRVVVTGLMGPGVDPHLYKASASDVTKLKNAEVVFRPPLPDFSRCQRDQFGLRNLDAVNARIATVQLVEVVLQEVIA